MNPDADNFDPDFEPMRLRDGIALYAACVAFLVALVALTIALDSWDCLGVTFIAYFVLGFVLNRKCLRGLVDFHPMENTVSNVAGAKLKFLIFWPISYGVLLCMLAVDRIL